MPVDVLINGLIAVRVVNQFKGGFFSALDGCVLVERAGCVGGRFFRVFPRGFPVADVVVTVAVCLAADGGGGQFAPAVAGKAVVDGIPLAGRAPRNGPCQAFLNVFPFHNSCGAAFVDHGRDQIPLFLIAPFQRHAVGHGHHGGQAASFHVLPGEGLGRAALQEPGRGDAAVFPVADAYGVLRRAAPRVDVACAAPEGVFFLGDEVGVVAHSQVVGFQFSVGIVGEALAGRGVRIANSHQKIPVDKAG